MPNYIPSGIRSFLFKNQQKTLLEVLTISNRVQFDQQGKIKIYHIALPCVYVNKDRVIQKRQFMSQKTCPMAKQQRASSLLSTGLVYSSCSSGSEFHVHIKCVSTLTPIPVLSLTMHGFFLCADTDQPMEVKMHCLGHISHFLIIDITEDSEFLEFKYSAIRLWKNTTKVFMTSKIKALQHLK